MITAGAVSVCEIFIVRVWQAKSRSASFLQRCRGTDGQEVVHFSYCTCNARWTNRPPYTPSSHAVALRQAINRDGPIAHSIEARDRDVLCVVVENMFVDFVSNGDDVEFQAKIANEFEFRPREHLARRIVRRVQDDGLCVIVKRGTQLSLIKCPFALRIGRRAKLYESRLCAGENRVWPVVFVEGFEYDDFIACVAYCQQRRDHGLG